MRQSYLRNLIVDDIVQSCAVRGLMMKASGNPKETEYSHVPLSIFPTPYPMSHYREALRYQPSMASLVGKLVA
jgi:hypothetical protein